MKASNLTQTSKDQQDSTMKSSSNEEETKRTLDLAQKEEKVCEHDKVWNKMCVHCGYSLSGTELEDYRKFAFLEQTDVVVKRSVGQRMIQERKEELIKEKKLVLVLDLDNTLMHAKELRLKPGTKVPLQVGQSSMIDELKGIYEFRLDPAIIYRVKLRPFLIDFFLQIHEKFDVFFYTAGIRRYGSSILELFQQHVQQKVKDEKKRESICSFLAPRKLIAREDIAKYETFLQQTIRSCRRDENGQSLGQNANYAKKTLSSLAGEDDSFFAILDDRSDVWFVEKQIQTPEGQTKTVQSECRNLQLVFPFQYWDVLPAFKNDGLNFFFKEAAFKKDLDIALPLAANQLNALHEKFFASEDPLQSDVKKCFKILRQTAQKHKIVNLRFLIEEKEAREKSYEKALCHRLRLKECSDVVPGDQENTNLFVCPDNASFDVTSQAQDAKNELGVKAEAVSCYWLYFQDKLQYPLPLDPFMAFKTVNIEEWNRIYQLQLEVLKIESPQNVKSYSELKKQLLLRRSTSDSEKKVDQQTWVNSNVNTVFTKTTSATAQEADQNTGSPTEIEGQKPDKRQKIE